MKDSIVTTILRTLPTDSYYVYGGKAMSYVSPHIHSEDWDIAFRNKEGYEVFLREFVKRVDGIIEIEDIQGVYPIFPPGNHYYLIHRIKVNGEEIVDAKYGDIFFMNVGTIVIDGISFLDIEGLIENTNETVLYNEDAIRQAQEYLEDINPSRYQKRIENKKEELKQLKKRIIKGKDLLESVTDIKRIKNIKSKLKELQEDHDDLEESIKKDLLAIPQITQEYKEKKKEVNNVLKENQAIKDKNERRKRVILNSIDHPETLGRIKTTLCSICKQNLLRIVATSASGRVLTCEKLLKHCNGNISR